MNIPLSNFIIIISILISPLIEASDEFETTLADVKKVMKSRESRVNQAMLDVESSILEANDFIVKKLPHESLRMEGEPLKCRKSHFPWLGKQDGYEYEDCTFLVNIKSDADIKGMMLAIAKRTLDGWEIDKNELTSQENLRPEKILNKEKYRFRRKVKN